MQVLWQQVHYDYDDIIIMMVNLVYNVVSLCFLSDIDQVVILVIPH